MSREALPKQLIPLKGQRSLLEIAFDRFDGLVPEEFRFICAGEKHRELILSSIDGLTEERFLGEPVGRDTLNAVGLAAAVLTAKDPEAIIGTFTADHIIEPIDTFQAIIEEGFQLAENYPDTLVTFGVTPNAPATGYGYLELGDAFQGSGEKISGKTFKRISRPVFQKRPGFLSLEQRHVCLERADPFGLHPEI
jgi:mannose-1-phosphate guanylyltransferase